MKRSPIRFDESDYGIVIWCTEHDWWQAFRFTVDDAKTAACGHEEREHPGDWRHRDAARKRAVYRRVTATA